MEFILGCIGFISFGILPAAVALIFDGYFLIGIVIGILGYLGICVAFVLPEAKKQKLKTAPYSTETAKATLNYFWSLNKTKAAIGKLYEQYIGYLCEKNGFEVEYFGIEKGVKDMGRDLICRKNSQTLLIQCKNWSKSKIIHAKYVHQLFGTLSQYAKQYPDEIIHGALITTTRFSLDAINAAKQLDIELLNIPMPKRFPIIKCKIHDNGERYYYLPSEASYDSIRINLNNGDLYCASITQAEEAGFQWWRQHIAQQSVKSNTE